MRTVPRGGPRHPPPVDEEHQLEALPVRPPSTTASAFSSSTTGPPPIVTKEPHQSSGHPSIVYPSRRDRYGHGPERNSWWIAKIILRSFTAVFAITIIAVELFVVLDTPLDVRNVDSSAAIWSVSALSLLWDVAEFVTIWVRHGYGITPKAHIWLEFVVCVFTGASMGGVWMQKQSVLGMLLESDMQESHIRAYFYVLCAFAFLSFLHFVLFIRAILDTKRGVGITPRVMYLPTGEPVIVVERRPNLPTPTPTLSKSRQDAISLLSSLPPSSRSIITVSDIATATDMESVASDERPLPPLPPASAAEESRGKPVIARGAELAPGPGYEPDEVERARAARGEAQAQHMALGGMDMTGIRRGDGPADKFLAEQLRKIPQRRNST